MTEPLEDHLEHYGILRKSGRYPYGSGGPESASNKGFLEYEASLRAQGLSEAAIAKGMGINTSQLRAAKSIARNAQRQEDIGMAQRLKDKGMSNVAIGKRMNIGESSVRALLEPGAKDKAAVLNSTASLLTQQVEEKKYLDIGTGVEHQLHISATKLSTAVSSLTEQGTHKVQYLRVRQLGTGKQTTIKVLTKADVPYSEVSKNRGDIKQINAFSDDGGRSYNPIQAPLSVNLKRVAVKYAEQGGTAADGVIYVRPGVNDVSLNGARYAQVRIAVGGTHYLKGMAMYKDDLPDGVDLMFNTNKSDTGDKRDAMKKMKDDPENPFGAVVSQILDPKTGKVRSAMNVVNAEGDWDKWSKNLSTQLLSKQSPKLAKDQLAMTFERRQKELSEINALTNPAVKKKLLESFADSTDSAAVHLKAAQLPRQATNVILPINSLNPREIYAPNFKDGEKVVLVRYPHGGIFEIPELTVNNRHPEARKALGTDAKDAVGIHSKVAERLSGADFDGDTVLVIPNNSGKIKTAPALEGLKGFDPQRSYPAYEGMKRMSARTKGIEMGLVSNLIADMTIRGAPTEHLARAVRHSMVVIDAEKHNLNYRQSAVDNGISQLKTLYQGRANSGASTLISRATSTLRVDDRKARSAKEGGGIDATTGKKVFTKTNETYIRDGKEVRKTFESTRLAETDDAHTLSSGTPIERVYAEHSNRLKKLANEARLSYLNTKPLAYSPSAKKAYASEVSSLQAKLNLAQQNRPLERQAQLLANAALDLKKQANPDMEKSEIKKLQGLELDKARARTGAGKQRIEITPSEWSAIQAGAISNNKLTEILANADLDSVKALATPRTATVMTSAKSARAKAMLESGFTQAAVADALGVSLSTLKSEIGGS